MQTFIMFGKYTPEATAKISADRTKKVHDLVGKHGGEIRTIYALLGRPDLVITLDLPGIKEATTLSVALAKATGISFSTAPAIPADEFDKITSKA